MPNSPRQIYELIEQFWVATGVAIGAAIALFGGYWKLMMVGTDVHSRFLTDLKAMEAKIRSSNLIPKIVSLFEDLKRDQTQSPTTDVKQILSGQEYAQKIRSIAEVENQIGDIKVLYSELKNSSFAIARSLLYLGVVSVVSILYFYVYGSGLTQVDQYGPLLLAYSIVILVVRLAPQIGRHDGTRRKFVDKYDEVMVGA
jgi:hypothetical protein